MKKSGFVDLTKDKIEMLYTLPFDNLYQPEKVIRVNREGSSELSEQVWIKGAVEAAVDSSQSVLLELSQSEVFHRTAVGLCQTEQSGLDQSPAIKTNTMRIKAVIRRKKTSTNCGFNVES